MILLFMIILLILNCCISGVFFRDSLINGHYVAGLIWLTFGVAGGISIIIYLNYINV